MFRSRAAPAVLLIVITAVALRFWRLSWGLAEEGWFPDEWYFSSRAAAFVPLSWASFKPRDFIYPPLTGYLAGAVTLAAHALGAIAGRPTGNSPEVILVTRGVCAAAGVATVGLAGVTARRMYSPGAGLAAAALLAVAPLHAMYAHVAATDVLLAAGFALTALLAFGLAERGTAALAVATGAAAGLTVGTKYTGLAVLAPVGWAIVERAAATRSASRAAGIGLATLGAFAATTLVVCLPDVLHLDQTIAALHNEWVLTSLRAPVSENNFLAPSLGWYGQPYLYQMVASLPYALGWPLYALALVGLGVALRRHTLGDRLVLATLLPYFLFMAHSPVVFPRYLLPLFPGLAVLAGRAAAAGPGPRATRLALLAGVLAYSLVLSASQVARLSSDQQRELAQWIATTFRGDRVRVASPFRPGYFRLARPLKQAGLAYVQAPNGHWLDERPEVFVLPEWEEIAIRRDRPASPEAADLERLHSGQAGYREAARWTSWYLQRDLYTRLDPAFAGDLWQGEIGFTVYVREAG